MLIGSHAYTCVRTKKSSNSKVYTCCEYRNEIGEKKIREIRSPAEKLGHKYRRNIGDWGEACRIGCRYFSDGMETSGKVSTLKEEIRRDKETNFRDNI